MAGQVISTIDITIKYHNARKRHRYRGSIQMQKVVPILDIGMNIGKQYR